MQLSKPNAWPRALPQPTPGIHWYLFQRPSVTPSLALGTRFAVFLRSLVPTIENTFVGIISVRHLLRLHHTSMTADMIHEIDYTETRRWHVTISCQPDGRPPQPVRPWKSGRVHLAEGSNVVVLELPYSTEFKRESRKFASGVRKCGKCDDGR